jgi:hypothetical protein
MKAQRLEATAVGAPMTCGRVARDAGEPLVSFRRADGATIRCELRYHDEFGVEAQFFRNGDRDRLR